jgi:hypothetical protein
MVQCLIIPPHTNIIDQLRDPLRTMRRVMQRHRLAIDQLPPLFYGKVQFPPRIKTVLVMEELGIAGDVITTAFAIQIGAEHGLCQVVVPEPGPVVVGAVFVSGFWGVAFIGDP